MGPKHRAEAPPTTSPGIADTLLGLVVFAAAAGPGVLYVRLARTRAPRHSPTSLEEAAELIAFGAAASAVGLLVALSIGKVTGLVDPEQIAAAPAHYVATEPVRTLGALGSTLLVSYGLVWILTTSLVHRGGKTIGPGETAWYAVMRRMLPKDRGVWVTVDLVSGGSLSGLAIAFTVESEDPRELVLAPALDMPIKRVTESGEIRDLPDQFIVVRGDQISSLSGRYTRTSPVRE